VLILLNFFFVANLGLGKLEFVNFLITSFVSGPETLMIATPEMPAPEDKAKIVIEINITSIKL